MMSSLIWKITFQKQALDISHLSYFSEDRYYLLFFPFSFFFLETTALQIQPCLESKLWCLRVIITRGCAVTEFKCFSSFVCMFIHTAHTDVVELYAGVYIFSTAVEPLKIYLTIFSKTLCLANKKQQLPSSHSSCS